MRPDPTGSTNPPSGPRPRVGNTEAMAATFRPFDAAVDTADVARIWHETRWIDSDNDGQRRALEAFLRGGAAEVGVIDGAAECLVHRTPGTIDHDRTALPASVISAVTTSHVGRRQRLASTLTSSLARAGIRRRGGRCPARDVRAGLLRPIRFRHRGTDAGRHVRPRLVARRPRAVPATGASGTR